MDRRDLLRAAGGLGLGICRGISADGDAYPPPESAGGWLSVPEDRLRAEAGVDPAAVASLREWLLQSDDRDFAAVVVRRGRVVLEVSRKLSPVTAVGNVKSCAKAICATVVSIASAWTRSTAGKKRLDFSDAAYDLIPWGAPLSDRRKSRITVRQLLNHTSGITPESTGVPNRGPWELILGHSEEPSTRSLAFDPGTDLGYSTHGLYHAALVCEHATGVPYDLFAVEHFFRPLGIERWWFETLPGDALHGSHPSHTLGISARDLARVGYCMLRGGRWAGRRIVPEWFVRETAAPSHDVRGVRSFGREAESFSTGWELPARLGGDSGRGIPADARFKPGSGGQLVAFVPSLDLAISRHTGSSGGWAYDEYVRRACGCVIG